MILRYTLKAKFIKVTIIRGEGKKARTVRGLQTHEWVQGSAIN